LIAEQSTKQQGPRATKFLSSNINQGNCHPAWSEGSVAFSFKSGIDSEHGF
jgi:hypothetical protein